MPKNTRANMDARWRYGIFVGRSKSSDQNSIALSDGSTTRARAMVRVAPSNRRDHDRVNKLCATPLLEDSKNLDATEQENTPQGDATSDGGGGTSHISFGNPSATPPKLVETNQPTLCHVAWRVNRMVTG